MASCRRTPWWSRSMPLTHLTLGTLSQSSHFQLHSSRLGGWEGLILKSECPVCGLEVCSAGLTYNIAGDSRNSGSPSRSSTPDLQCPPPCPHYLSQCHQPDPVRGEPQLESPGMDCAPYQQGAKSLLHLLCRIWWAALPDTSSRTTRAGCRGLSDPCRMWWGTMSASRPTPWKCQSPPPYPQCLFYPGLDHGRALAWSVVVCHGGCKHLQGPSCQARHLRVQCNPHMTDTMATWTSGWEMRNGKLSGSSRIIVRCFWYLASSFYLWSSSLSSTWPWCWGKLPEMDASWVQTRDLQDWCRHVWCPCCFPCITPHVRPRAASGYGLGGWHYDCLHGSLP